MLSLLIAFALAGAPSAPRLADGVGCGAERVEIDLGPASTLSPVLFARVEGLPTPLSATMAPTLTSSALGWMALATVMLALDPAALGTPTWARDRGLSLSDRPLLLDVAP